MTLKCCIKCQKRRQKKIDWNVDCESAFNATDASGFARLENYSLETDICEK